MTPDEIRTIEPTLHKSYYGGFFTPSDATGDIHKFTRGLAAACVRRGAKFIYDADIETIAPADGGFRIDWRSAADLPEVLPQKEVLQADGVVICAGVASRHFAAMLGDRVNIYPVKGYSITIDLDTPQSRNATPHVSLLDEAAKIVTSRLGEDRFRVAGTAEFNGFNYDIRADRIQPLTDWVRHNFSDIATSKVIPWAGLRPMMPNMMPVVRAGKQPGVFYNTGHGHLGWTLSAATAQIIAQAVDAWRGPEVPFSSSSPSLASDDHNPGFTTLDSQR